MVDLFPHVGYSNFDVELVSGLRIKHVLMNFYVYLIGLYAQNFADPAQDPDLLIHL